MELTKQQLEIVGRALSHYAVALSMAANRLPDDSAMRTQYFDDLQIVTDVQTQLKG